MTEHACERKEFPYFWGKPLKVVNVGLEIFAENLEKQDIQVFSVDWNPPAAGRQDIVNALEDLLS
jgi:hypothetical protein